jgi:heparan-alpha-glucosaminide N-acetyltransferase
MGEAVEPQQSPPAPPAIRVSSVDAYRGFVMFLMMAEVLHLSRIAQAVAAGSKEASGELVDFAVKFWRFLAFHQSHVEWRGCSLHDLIQPSFSFLVGVAVPFSIANRLARGQGRRGLILHAAWRALLLCLLGIFLRSTSSRQTNFTFEDTLTQIGLGYLPLFLLGLVRPRWQWLALVAILVGYWGLFAAYPLPGSDFDWKSVGVPVDWAENFAGFASHWNKNSNPAWAFDQWFLNLFPREKPFTHNGGGYATLSFIPTLATMILGLLAGGWLQSATAWWKKVGWLVLAGGVSLGLGLAADYYDICPIVKRIWTPSWTLYSGGWCFFILAGLYLVMDVAGLQAWAFPLRVIGMNSIAAYCIAHLIGSFVLGSFKTHLGQNVFKGWFPEYETLFSGIAILLVYWLILFWMYRRRIFLRI